MDVRLVMFKADGTRRDFPLKMDRLVVGRTNTCDLRIPLSSVSRQHCELRVEDAGLRVRDLGSSNGTYHNSVRVQEAELAAGDELVIGPVVFRVVIDGEPGEIEPVRTIVEDGHAGADEVTAASLDDEIARHIAASQGKLDSNVPAALMDDSGSAMGVNFGEQHDGHDDDDDDADKTVDLDDPIAALESLAADDEDENKDG